MFLALDRNRAPAAGLHSVLNDGILGIKCRPSHDRAKCSFLDQVTMGCCKEGVLGSARSKEGVLGLGRSQLR